MLQPLQNALAKLVLRYAPARKRWMGHVAAWLPIMEKAFVKEPRAHLLTLLLLDDLQADRLQQAEARRQKLERMAQASGQAPDQALVHVLTGVCHFRRGNLPAMSYRMRAAEEAGHRFHLPHVMQAGFFLHDMWNFQRCCEELDKAIDCVYSYPPLDESKRRGIAVMHSDMALARTMMRCPEEAERLLQKAEPARDTPEYLHALAALRALQGCREEARCALDALEKADPRRCEGYREGILMMLEGTHPHFTAKTPDLQAIAAYWDWFRREEKEMRRLLTHQGPRACFMHQREAFSPLVPEPASIDRMVHNYVMIGGRPEMHFMANHSATYQALIDALIAACPEEVKQHWTLRGFPGGLLEIHEDTGTPDAAAPKE